MPPLNPSYSQPRGLLDPRAMQGLRPMADATANSARPAAQMGASPAAASGLGLLRQPLGISDFGTPIADPGVMYAPEAQKIAPLKPKFFDKNGAWRDVAGALADAVATASGGQATYLPMKLHDRQQQAEWDRQDSLRGQDRQWSIEDRDAKLKAPQYFMSGRDRVAFDPTSGQATTIYDGPEDFQQYADEMGFEPGTAEYVKALQDFVLRGNGPTALDGRKVLEGVRQGNRVALEDVRSDNRAELRSRPTYAQTHRAPRAARQPSPATVVGGVLSKIASGQPLNAGEQQIYSDYRSKGTGKRQQAGAAASVSVTTPEQARALPPGTVFRTPDGRVKVR